MAQTRLKQTALLVFGAGLVVANRVALGTGARRRVDGWRRAAGLALRGEASTFELSAFGLNAWSDSRSPGAGLSGAMAHVERRLAAFLANEPASHVRIRRGESEHKAEPNQGPSYTLAFAPWVRGVDRFVPPDLLNDRPEGDVTRSGDPLLKVVCRIDEAGSCDVWIRVNHVGADGVPIQEMLSRLEVAWGQAERIVYPNAAEFEPHSNVRPCPGRPELGQIQAFVDFQPLLAWRARQNQLLPEPMTVAAALLWRLSRRAPFAGKHMGSTVEVAPVDGLGRGVGVVVVQPSRYLDGPKGLREYVKYFNRQVELTRTRASSGCKSLDALAFVPPAPAKAVLDAALRRGGPAFGSLGLTIIKDAKVFVAPIGDVAHADGFIAIGSLSLPTSDGRSVGCLTVKGPRNRIGEYPAIISAAVQSCSEG